MQRPTMMCLSPLVRRRRRSFLWRRFFRLSPPRYLFVCAFRASLLASRLYMVPPGALRPPDLRINVHTARTGYETPDLRCRRRNIKNAD